MENVHSNVPIPCHCISFVTILLMSIPSGLYAFLRMRCRTLLLLHPLGEEFEITQSRFGKHFITRQSHL